MLTRRNTRSDPTIRFPNATFSFRFFLDISLYSSRFFPQTFFDWIVAMQRYRGNFYNISKSDTVPKFNFFRRSFVFPSSLKDFPLDWIHSSRCTVTRNKRLCNFEMGVSDSEKEGNRVSLPAGGNDVYRRMGREFRKWKLGVVWLFPGRAKVSSEREGNCRQSGIVSMVGSGFNAVPRVFYSREMEPPFVAFFLDITTFIDATPSRILVFSHFSL